MPDQEVDVRPLAKPDKHPHIFRAFGQLTVGESFVLVNNHDPRHLRAEFEADYPGSYGWDYLERGPVWRIRISRLSSTALPRILADTGQLTAGDDAPDTAGAVWKLAMRQRDLDSNIIRLQPGRGIDSHLGPDLDVLLLDLELPILDGRKLAELARQRGVECRRIVILSGHAAEELHRLFPPDSCLAVINKADPNQQNALRMILDSLILKH